MHETASWRAWRLHTAALRAHRVGRDRLAFVTSNWSALPESILGCSPRHTTVRRHFDAVGPAPLGRQPVPDRRLRCRHGLGVQVCAPAFCFEGKRFARSSIRRINVGTGAISFWANRIPLGNLGFGLEVGYKHDPVFSGAADILRTRVT